MLIEDLTTDWQYTIVFRTGRLRPRYDDTITGDESGATFDLTEGVVGAATMLEDAYADHGTYLTALDSQATTLRNKIKPVPGGGTIVGLHYHEDQLYAIRDMAQITIASGDEGILIPGMYVYNDAGQVGVVATTDDAALTVNISAVDPDGFSVSPTDPIHIALNVRFTDGDGEFNKGDAVLGATSAWAGDVGFIDRRDGVFSSGNALGVGVFINGPDTDPTATEVFNNQTATGSMVIESIIFQSLANALLVDDVSAQSDYATFWRSTDDSWEAADIGSVLDFTDGQNDPSSEVPVPFSDVYLPNSVLAGAGNFPWTGDPQTLKLKDGTTISNTIAGGAIPGLVAKTNYIRCSDYKVTLLEGDVLTGIQFRFHGRDPGTSPGAWSARVIQAPSNYTYITGITPGAVLTDDDVPAGTTQLWWGVTVTPALLTDPAFGTHFVAQSYASFSNPRLDSVELVVHGERLPQSKLYLWGGGQDLGYISVSASVVNSGDWATNDADGYFRLTDWSTIEIPVGTEIRTATGGLGSLIALAGGNVRKPNLPGSKRLDAERARYQMISHNFFATEERNAIYGCSGAGQAFWYDGSILDFISTGATLDVDKPRHLSEHQSRLCLGYLWGEVYVSDANSPTTFSGQHFAASYGFGDKITGLEPASGDALAVFTESATHVLIGNNGGDAAVRQDVINHKVGAIEYTVQNMGNRPIFTSFRGIETLETMDQYSNFFTAPLTYDVSPWLLERLQVAAGAVSTDEAVVNSVVVRNKNQYRLFFADGYVLTLTYVGKEKDPQNTIQQYWFNSNRAQYARCYATAQGVTTDGRDRAFFSVEPRPGSPETGASIATPEIQYAYELDQGFSFDGGVIDSSFLMTHFFDTDQQGGPNTAQTKGFDCIQVHGYATGHADLHLSRTVNNDELDDPVLGYEPAPMGALVEPATNEMSAKYTKGRLNARGFAVSVHVSHSSAVEFPHTVQMVTFTDDTQLRINR